MNWTPAQIAFAPFNKAIGMVQAMTDQHVLREIAKYDLRSTVQRAARRRMRQLDRDATRSKPYPTGTRYGLLRRRNLARCV
jgi:hypothetical protein